MMHMELNVHMLKVKIYCGLHRGHHLNLRLPQSKPRSLCQSQDTNQVCTWFLCSTIRLGILLNLVTVQLTGQSSAGKGIQLQA